MASLIIGAGVLAYSQVKKKREAKKAHNHARFTELERDNASRIAALQAKKCFCQQSDWTGGGCEHHGYVPPAAERDRLAAEERARRARDGIFEEEGAVLPPAYTENGHSDVYAVPGSGRQGTGRGGVGEVRTVNSTMSSSERLGDGGGDVSGRSRDVDERDEERRVKMKTGGLAGWKLRRKRKEKVWEGGRDSALIR